MMRRLMSVTAMALTLAACASEEPRPGPPPAPAPAPSRLPPPPPVSAPAPGPQPAPPPRDACGAAEAQGLVGRPRSEIPVPLHPGLQRVACTTCPVTQDYNPRRLNFFYETSTGIIKQVKCG
jgi:hypothetical protein